MNHSFKAIHFLRKKASAQEWVNEIQCGAVMCCTIFPFCTGAIQGLYFVPRKLKLSQQAMQVVSDPVLVIVEAAPVVCLCSWNEIFTELTLPEISTVLTWYYEHEDMMTTEKNKFAFMLCYIMVFCPTVHHPVPILFMLLKAFVSYKCIK